METQKWITQMEEEEQKSTKIVEVSIIFRVHLPVSKDCMLDALDRRCLFRNAETKLRDFMSRHDLRNLEHMPSDEWSVHRYVEELDDEDEEEL
jgi:hypothetical protein